MRNEYQIKEHKICMQCETRRETYNENDTVNEYNDEDNVNFTFEWMNVVGWMRERMLFADTVDEDDVVVDEMTKLPGLALFPTTTRDDGVYESLHL